MRSLAIKTIALSILSSSLLLGVTPNIGSIEKEIKELNIKRVQPDIPEIKVDEYKAPMIDSGKTILVNDFIITKNDSIDSKSLENFYLDYKGKELTFNQLQEVVTSITNYYREKGFFVARAYIPKQNVKNGVLEISVIEGKYGEFKLTNNSLIKNSVIQGILNNTKNNSSIISNKSLERAMLIVQDTPGAVISKADILSGKKVGTSDFSIIADASKRFDGYVVVDNTGSRYTGKNRVMIGANINSPFKLGDKISIFGLVSKASNLKNGKISYSLPLMSNGLKGELSYTQTNYSLIEEYDNLDAIGISKTFEGKLTYPFIRTKLENLDGSIILAHKDIKDEINSSGTSVKKDTQSITLGLDYNKAHLSFGLNSFSKASIALKYGNLSFDENTDKVSDEAGANTNGNYSKINIKLANSLALTQKITLETSLRMQYALGNKNLDGSEDFSTGGTDGIKLYPDSEVSAENGYVFNIEAKYQLPSINAYTHKVSVFYDRGRAFMANNTVGYEAKSLQDLGIGYYVSYNDFFGQIQAAWKVNSKDITSEPDRNCRILFQAGMVF